jgi:ketopantoate hydroxymethyltransferase
MVRIRFVRCYAEIGEAIVEALERFSADVRSGAFPRKPSYHLP